MAGVLVKYLGRKWLAAIFASLVFAVGKWLGMTAQDIIGTAVCLMGYALIEGALDGLGILIGRLKPRQAVEDGAKSPELKTQLEKAIGEKWGQN
jgi:hypothetical protein